ncbi:hypothetical protein Tco_0395151, partial [Tanacetum coccineum]
FASTKAGLIIGLGLVEVEAQYEDGVFPGVVAANTRLGRVVLRLFDLVGTGLIVAGPTDDATDCANMGTIRL